MVDRQFHEWFRPRPGRCSTCAHHAVTLTERDDFDCSCEVEDGQLEGWLPGMHLDRCAFPAVPGEQGCPAWSEMELPPDDDNELG
ncbi:MAG: hypothetical protein EXR60_00700 [Dehalococcoidia bacterium]|nr:hypothetical protein [Dehalococcoidia bacterium]